RIQTTIRCMIEIEQLTKRYGDLTAVDRLSLTVEAGAILGLVGPNGSGKTTTLRCLAGILPATEGVLRVDGYDLEENPVEAKRRLAFVPDEPRLFEHLTAWDHLTIHSRLYHVADGAERAAALLEELGLEDRRDSFPSELSRGMKQKLMTAMALLHRPRALIFDEPLTGLDPRAMRQTKEMIVAAGEQGAAVIVSSHLLSLVEEISARILILRQGRKVVEGTLSEIRASLPDLEPDADLEEIFLKATEDR
ncbi:MAG: ABC transporter ATP-binding protein, partial [Thermoanaerobaculia bacterium]